MAGTNGWFVVGAEVVEDHVGWGIEVNVLRSVSQYCLFVFPMCEGGVCDEAKCFVKVFFVVSDVAMQDVLVPK